MEVKEEGISSKEDKSVSAEELVDDLNQRGEARKFSIKEGTVSGFSSGVGDNYIGLFGIALNANATQLGFLSAFPGFLSPLSQLIGSKLIEKQARKSIVARYVLVQALMWVPLSLLGLLFWRTIFINSLPWLLVFLYSVLAIVGGFIGPAWFSWMGDIIPENERGRYFGKRNRIAQGASILGLLLGAIILDFFETKGLAVIGFAILFVSAFISRTIAYSYLKKQYEPRLELKADYYFSFWAFLKKYTNFTKFTIFIALFNLALAIGSPFFALYMKQDLGFSYMTIMVINMSMLVFIIIFNSLAGKFSDKYGNLRLLYIGCFLLALYPALWLFMKTPFLLIAVAQLIGGIGNAAYAISLTNFIYDTVTPQRRAICVAYLNVLAGIGVLIGPLIGGYLIDNVSISFMKPILLVFVVSAIGRFAVPLFFMPSIKEIKQYQKFPFSTLVSYPATTVLRLTRQFVQTIYPKKSHVL